MKKIIISVLIVSALGLTACATVYLDAQILPENISMTNELNREYTIVKHFEDDVKGVFTLFDLVTITNPDIEKLLQKAIISGKGDGAVNVTIKGQVTFVDGLIPVTLGVIGGLLVPPYGVYAAALIGFRTYTVEGDIVRYTKGD